MGKPYWGINNLATKDDTVVTTRTENASYPAINLNSNRLWPGWRSADRTLVINGTATEEYVYFPDAGAGDPFRITGSFTCEFVFKTSSITTSQEIINKSSSSTSGYLIRIINDELRVVIRNATNDGTVDSTDANFEINKWYRIKVVYDATVPEVIMYKQDVDGLVQLTTNVVSQLPTTIVADSKDFLIGVKTGDPSVTNRFTGQMSYIGIAADKYTNNAWLKPGNCLGYWDYNQMNLNDSSGNDRTLSGFNIDAGDYSNRTPLLWVNFEFSSAQQPVFVFIDRRHNLSSVAKVQLFRQDVHTVGSTIADVSSGGVSVTKEEPILLTLSSPPTESQWFHLLIHDSGNSDGYLEIPYIFIGMKTDMERSFLRGYGHSDLTLGKVIPDSGGGFTGYVQSEKLWQAQLKFRAHAGDYSTLKDVVDFARLARPAVFCEDIDQESEKTRLVYVTNAMRPDYGHIVNTNHFVDLSLQEAG